MKTLSAQRPAYLPTFGQLWLFSRADEGLFADHLFYSKQTSLTQTTLPTGDERICLSVPVQHSHASRVPIWQVRLNRASNWRKKHFKTIYLRYKYAPYFEYYVEGIRKIFERDFGALSDFLWAILQWHREVLLPHKTIYRSREEDIRNPDTLRAWAEEKQISTFLFFSEEHDYYRRHFSSFTLQPATVKIPELRVPFSYFAEMAFLPLLFHLGPEAARLLEPEA